ncbi:MAG TPA: NfeD family protein, partial [Acidimicrobiales bacterium]
IFVWLVVGLVLVLVELHHLALYALFGALGCFVAAGVAVVAPDAVALQVAAGAAAGTAGIVAVRPFVSRAFAARRQGHVIHGVHGGLVGGEGVTLDEVGDVHRGGHVRLTGERWLAVSGGGEPIPAGTPVLVTAVRGTTLVVWPVDGLDHSLGAAAGLDPARPEIGARDADDAPDGADGRTT